MRFLDKLLGHRISENDPVKCKHGTVHTVILQDKYYDMMTDNDDLDDFPTIVEVTYNNRGKILSSKRLDWRTPESSLQEQANFFYICNIGRGYEEHKKYTSFRR